MRPSGETAAASVKISDAPPTALLPKWTRCQSLANPSVLEYWHMGETTIRLRSVSSRRVSSSNSMGLPFQFPEDWRNKVNRLSVVAPMRFHVLVFRHRVEQTENV